MTTKIDRDNATIADAAKLWIKNCEREGLERATLRSYRGHVDHHILPRIGSELIRNMKASDIRNFMDDMLDDVTHSMTKKVMVSLRSIYKEAVVQELITDNVARDVRMRKGKRVKEEAVIPTKHELKLMLKNVSDRHRAFITTLIMTGMRSSEIRGLVWDCVDFDAQIIKVRQRADRFNQMGDPKSHSSRRDIPMAPMVYKALKAWKTHCPKGELGLVFPNGAGNVEGQSNIYHRILAPLQIECGIIKPNGKAKYGMHSFRHAAASLFIEQDWTPKRIQKLMGHSKITMTYDTYGHLFEDREKDQEDMAKMEADLFAA